MALGIYSSKQIVDSIFIQPTDPVTSPGVAGPGSLWYNTSTGALSVRDTDNATWQTVTGGVIQVNTLPLVADGSLALTYFNKKDRLSYTLNEDGTLWLPVSNPGWPRRDGASDLEHEGADPFTWDNQSSTVVNFNSARLSHIRFTATNTTNIGMYYVAAPSPATKKYTAQISMATALNQASGASQTEFGIGVRNSSNGKIISVMLSHVVGFVGSTMRVSHWTNSTTFLTDVFRGTLYELGMSKICVQIENDGTNLIARWCEYADGSEADFCQILTETIAGFLGSWDQVGYCMRNTDGAAQVLLSDWFRVL